MRWGPRYDTLAAARTKYVGPNSRQKWQFECSICHKQFQQKEVEVDHKTPCGTLKSWKDIAGFTRRLFCEADQLRTVCKPCHKRVTNAEATKSV